MSPVSMPGYARLSPDFAKPLTVLIGRSRRLTGVLLGMHALALLAVALTPVGWPWRVALVAVVIASAIASFRHYGYFAARAVAIVAVREHAGAYSVRLAGSAAFVPATLTGFTLLPFALLLEFKVPPARWRRSVAVVSDAVDAQTFQHLRARLRLRGSRPPAVERAL